MKGTITGILNPSKRSGSSDKGPWNIMEVEVEKEDGSIVKADTFDTVTNGDVVDLEPNNYTNPNTGKTYNGWKASVPRAPRPGAPQSQQQSNTEMLQAIRMVYRETKYIRDGIDKLLGNDALLGASTAATEPTASVTTTVPMTAEGDMPEDFLKAEPAPARDWSKVGKSDEPYVEPLPEEPGDLNQFMNS